VFFSSPSAPAPRQEEQPLVLFEPANLFSFLPGEFTSGPTAEGSDGAAGRRFCLLFSLQKKVGRRAGAKPRYNQTHPTGLSQSDDYIIRP